MHKVKSREAKVLIQVHQVDPLPLPYRDHHHPDFHVYHSLTYFLNFTTCV